jgi:hypothetical protein
MNALRAYIDAVTNGHFRQAAIRFASATYGNAPTVLIALGALRVEWLPGPDDRRMTNGSSEGLNGAWWARRNRRALVYGFDEWLVVDPIISPANRALLEYAGIVERRR